MSNAIIFLCDGMMYVPQFDADDFDFITKMHQVPTPEDAERV